MTVRGWIWGAGLVLIVALMVWNGLMLQRMTGKLDAKIQPPPPADIELDAIRAEVQHLRRIVESIPQETKAPKTIKACH